MREKKRLEGIGGWLAALIVSFVLSAFLSVGIAADHYVNMPDIRSHFFFNELILSVLTSAIPIYAAYHMLLVKNRHSVLWGIAAAWIGWTALALGRKILFIAATGEPSSTTFQDTALTVAFSVTITAYLIRSVRVRNTYGYEAQGS